MVKTLEMFNWTRCGILTVGTTFGMSMGKSLFNDFRNAGIDTDHSLKLQVRASSSEIEIKFNRLRKDYFRSKCLFHLVVALVANLG